jgi:hypothetical protein
VREESKKEYMSNIVDNGGFEEGMADIEENILNIGE